MATTPKPTETNSPQGISILVIAHGRVCSSRVGPPWASANVDSMEKQLDEMWPDVRRFMLGIKRKKFAKK